MIKILSLSLLLLANVHALDVLKCDKCSISKEYIKILQKYIKGNLFLEKHLEVLSRLYPDKFDAKVVKKLFH